MAVEVWWLQFGVQLFAAVFTEALKGLIFGFVHIFVDQKSDFWYENSLRPANRGSLVWGYSKKKYRNASSASNVESTASSSNSHG